MISDHKDLYIRNSSHPSYEENRIIEDDLTKVILQKLEMIIFSNKGDLYGDQFFGSDLEYYLWSTRVPSDEIKKKMLYQVRRYIPELERIGYELNVEIYEGTLQDIMYLKWKINGYNINFIID
jgi:hypothetical protein